MTDSNTDQIKKEDYPIENGIRKVKFKNETFIYEYSLLSAREMNVLFPKFLALVSPILATGYESFSGSFINSKKSEDDIDDGFNENETISLIPLATVLGNQLYQPEVQELLNNLIIDLKKDGKPLDVDDAFRGQYDKYLKLVEQAFKDNFSVPLGKLLEEKGYAGMLTSLLAVMKEIKE